MIDPFQASSSWFACAIAPQILKEMSSGATFRLKHESLMLKCSVWSKQSPLILCFLETALHSYIRSALFSS
jgi:hypothetical protein